MQCLHAGVLASLKSSEHSPFPLLKALAYRICDKRFMVYFPPHFPFIYLFVYLSIDFSFSPSSHHRDTAAAHAGLGVHFQHFLIHLLVDSFIYHFMFFYHTPNMDTLLLHIQDHWPSAAHQTSFPHHLPSTLGLTPRASKSHPSHPSRTAAAPSTPL